MATAAALSLRRTDASAILTRLIRVTHFLPAAASRSFTTRTFKSRIPYDNNSTIEDDVDRSYEICGHIGRHNRHCRINNPFINDQFTLNNRFAEVGGLRKRWNVMEDEEGLYLRIDMPGIGKENVSVYTEKNTLVIEGEVGYNEEMEIEKYPKKIKLAERMFRVDEIKAEMKNGVLKIMVPKLNYEDRSNVRRYVEISECGGICVDI